MQISRRSFVVGASAGLGLGLARPVRALPDLAGRPDGSAFSAGVASGDPTTDGVVLWTRLADRFHGADVRWEVFDPASGMVLRRRTAPALAERDGTVQVAVDGLPSGATLGYRFRGPGGAEVVGRTRTRAEDPARMRIGVLSCSKYSDGWDGYAFERDRMFEDSGRRAATSSCSLVTCTRPGPTSSCRTPIPSSHRSASSWWRRPHPPVRSPPTWAGRPPVLEAMSTAANPVDQAG